MKMKFIAVILIAQTLFCQIVFAQTRGAGNIKIKKPDGKTEEVKLYDASYALVIGNGKYTNGWDNLPGVGSDVAAVKKVLADQGFNVETAENLSSRDFSNRIQQFIDDYGYQPNNRLLIYYAGHGHTLKSTGDGRDLGYVVPVDAPLPSKDELGFKRKAIPMDDILNFAKKIQAKHALFVFDSCFSGRLVSRGEIAVPPIIQESIAYPVRQFITAGAANQPVPDESIFRRSFVRALEGEADRNVDGYITGTELAEYLKEKVTNYSNRQQTPQYGKINDIELDKGDFVFIIPKIQNQPEKIVVADGKSPTPVSTVNAINSISIPSIQDSLIYGLVMDTSSSFRGSFEDSINAGKMIVNYQKGNDTFIIRFVSSDKIEVVQDFTNKTDDLKEVLDGLYTEGGSSDITDAIYMSLEKIAEYRKNEIKKRAIVLITDGDERYSYYTREQLFNLIKETKIKIFTIGFTKINSAQASLTPEGQVKAINFLDRLGKESGGKTFILNSKMELTQVVTEVNKLLLDEK